MFHNFDCGDAPHKERSEPSPFQSNWYSSGCSILDDAPPAATILFYVVTAGCPAGTVACGSQCVDLATDPVARDALMTTLLFIGVTIPLELFLGLGIALVLNEAFRGRGLLRAVVLIPWAIPTVVASQMWRFIFNDRYGLVNFMLFGADTSKSSSRSIAGSR